MLTGLEGLVKQANPLGDVGRLIARGAQNATLRSALPAAAMFALPSAAVGALTAEEGHRLEGAGRGALSGGLAGAITGGLHSSMASQLSKPMVTPRPIDPRAFLEAKMASGKMAALTRFKLSNSMADLMQQAQHASRTKGVPQLRDPKTFQMPVQKPMSGTAPMVPGR